MQKYNCLILLPVPFEPKNIQSTHTFTGRENHYDIDVRWDSPAFFPNLYNVSLSFLTSSEIWKNVSGVSSILITIINFYVNCEQICSIYKTIKKKNKRLKIARISRMFIQRIQFMILPLKPFQMLERQQPTCIMSAWRAYTLNFGVNSPVSNVTIQLSAI